MKKGTAIYIFGIASLIAIQLSVFSHKLFGWEDGSDIDFCFSVALLSLFGIGGVMLKFLYKLKWTNVEVLFSLLFLAYAICAICARLI